MQDFDQARTQGSRPNRRSSRLSLNEPSWFQALDEKRPNHAPLFS